MSDLVERLRSEATNLASNGWQTNCCSPGCGIASNLATEAADRIEQLEAQLNSAKKDTEKLRIAMNFVNYWSNTKISDDDEEFEEVMDHCKYLADAAIAAEGK